MGIDNILERIAVDAEKSASDVTSEARKKATEIYAERTAEAKTASAEQIEAAEKEAINTINHIKSTAALESRKLILGAKRAVIDEVFDDIPSAFRRMPKDEYAAFLAGVAVKSSEKGTLYFANADFDVADKVKELLKDKPQYKVAKSTVKDISSGFCIKYDNVKINCSIDSIVENMRPELESIVVSKLFPENTEKK
ncbi:MAG: V-type ATP synthase subunit E [Clostridia bacterium]|nr:V-type ATP synthase subunit E [Clostridia bacterium]